MPLFPLTATLCPEMSLLDSYLQKKIPDYKLGSLSPATVSFAAALDLVSKVSPDLSKAILGELHDQRSNLKLIASENYASLSVLLAMGNWLSDKYAEGSVGHRFYAGCEGVDTVEGFVVDAAKKLFNAGHAYAQPHSGVDANLVAYWTLLSQGVEAPALKKLGAKSVNDLSEKDWEDVRQQLGNQKMMGMALDAGGHLTHGFRPNISGKLFRQTSYTVDPKSGLLDYDAVRKTALEAKPFVIVAGYSSYPRKINFRTFREIADEVGAFLMVDMAHFAGLVAGKVFGGDYDPVPHAHIVTTTTHKTLRGPRGGLVLCEESLASTLDRGCPLVLGGPLAHVMAAKGIALTEANSPEFKKYARNVVTNAQALAKGLQDKGVTVVTGGTENHIVLIDIQNFGLTGRQAETALRQAHVTTNKNSIPSDPNGPWYASGVRLGSAAMTTLGMGPAEMGEIADIIQSVLKSTKSAIIAKGANAGKPSKARVVVDEKIISRSESRVKELLQKFPLYPEIEL